MNRAPSCRLGMVALLILSHPVIAYDPPTHDAISVVATLMKSSLVG